MCARVHVCAYGLDGRSDLSRLISSLVVKHKYSALSRRQSQSTLRSNYTDFLASMQMILC